MPDAKRSSLLTLFSIVAIFGDSLARDLVGEAPPEVLGSARLLVLPDIETLSGSARARRDCWALMKAGGLVAAA